jgi:hypothetical protein
MAFRQGDEMETALVRGGYRDSVELDVPMNYRKTFSDL